VDHHVFTWGANEYGQLGHGDQDNRCDVTFVESLRGFHIVDIWASHSSSYALTDDGSLFVFGSNEHSQLGLGQTNHSFISLPLRLQTDPILRFFTGSFSNHAFFETLDKRIFSFGSNEYRETCNSKKTDVIFEPEDVTSRLKKDDYEISNIVTGAQCSFILYR
jgi:alpha-tubulin suppressor-like RCC1 family protein